MTDIITRNPRNEEIPVLQNIWEKVFGNVGMVSFFDHFYAPEFCIIAEIDGIPSAMGFFIPFGFVECVGNSPDSIPCAMIYSIATMPQHRNKGLGTSVVNELIKNARENGYPAVVLCPQEDGLFEYYKNRTILFDWFYADEMVINHTSAGLCSNISAPIQLSASKYNDARNELFKESIYIKHDLHVIEYQQQLCTELGGGFYNVGDSYIVIERQDKNTVWIKELLTQPCIYDEKNIRRIAADVISSIYNLFPACDYMIRFPACNGKGRRFGMLALENDDLNKAQQYLNGPFLPWYGMAFD